MPLPQDPGLKERHKAAGIRARPPMQHVVITGRGAPPELVAAADTVSEVGAVKHSFAQGIRAQKGVEL